MRSICLLHQGFPRDIIDGVLFEKNSVGQQNNENSTGHFDALIMLATLLFSMWQKRKINNSER